VTDTFNHRIQKFTTDGEFVASWEADLVYGIAADAAGVLYVVNFNRGTVMKFDTEGHFLGEWGELGQDPGQMEQTFGIAIHPLGYAYITQGFPYRVHKFDLDGNFIMRWG
jgi:DNA-binding beta-propeller fold protein YncE